MEANSKLHSEAHYIEVVRAINNTHPMGKTRAAIEEYLSSEGFFKVQEDPRDKPIWVTSFMAVDYHYIVVEYDGDFWKATFCLEF